MHHGTVGGVAEVVRLGVAAAYQFTQVVAVIAVGSAVTDDSSRGAEQRQAAQIRQRLLQLAQQGLQFIGALRLFDDRQQVEGDLRVERHVQADLRGQIGGVVDGVLTLVLLGFAQLVEQLPEQQGQQQ
ncbi:hypothetical protein D3C86_1416540 [compost metagenome]